LVLIVTEIKRGASPLSGQLQLKQGRLFKGSPEEEVSIRKRREESQRESGRTDTGEIEKSKQLQVPSYNQTNELIDLTAHSGWKEGMGDTFQPQSLKVLLDWVKKKRIIVDAKGKGRLKGKRTETPPLFWAHIFQEKFYSGEDWEAQDEGPFPIE